MSRVLILTEHKESKQLNQELEYKSIASASCIARVDSVKRLLVMTVVSANDDKMNACANLSIHNSDGDSIFRSWVEYRGDEIPLGHLFERITGMKYSDPSLAISTFMRMVAHESHAMFIDGAYFCLPRSELKYDIRTIQQS